MAEANILAISIPWPYFTERSAASVVVPSVSACRNTKVHTQILISKPPRGIQFTPAAPDT